MTDQSHKNVPDQKTVLVTGAAGALARRIIARLHGKYRVIAVDFRRKVELDPEIASYKVDLHKRGFEDLFTQHRIDAVIHIGRMFTHESSVGFRYNANVLGTKKLLELCRKYFVKQVIIHSTYFVYGAHPYNPALLDEDSPLKASEITQDLVDSVELENLAQIHMWKYPELNMTILRPCNVLGPGVKNSMSLLLSRPLAPVLAGFSPLMQFLHVDDMADALLLAFEQNKPGIYNVAPDDWVPYQEAVKQCGCQPIPVPSIPPILPKTISNLFKWNAFFPPYLINYFKYPVIIDAKLFRETFGWKPNRSLGEIFTIYRRAKKMAA